MFCRVHKTILTLNSTLKGTEAKLALRPPYPVRRFIGPLIFNWVTLVTIGDCDNCNHVPRDRVVPHRGARCRGARGSAACYPAGSASAPGATAHPTAHPPPLHPPLLPSLPQAAFHHLLCPAPRVPLESLVESFLRPCLALRLPRLLLGSFLIRLCIRSCGSVTLL